MITVSVVRHADDGASTQSWIVDDEGDVPNLAEIFGRVCDAETIVSGENYQKAGEISQVVSFRGE